jgi:hypothetical protein
VKKQVYIIFRPPLHERHVFFLYLNPFNNIVSDGQIENISLNIIQIDRIDIKENILNVFPKHIWEKKTGYILR